MDEHEIIPSMDDFKEELSHSFRKLCPGDIVTGTVIGISDSEVTVDLNSYAEGIIRAADLSSDPRFSIKADIHIGDTISAVVIRENKEGAFLLSSKEADSILSWDKLREAKDSRRVCRVKIAESVKGGATTYLYGIRAFIPASQLSLTYTEDTSAFVGRELDVIVTEVNRDSAKLVLSAREVLRDIEAKERTGRISRLQVGLIVRGTVEKLMPFGAFVNIGEGLSGLVHISEICDRRIKSPSEVLKVGDEVTVKIKDVHDSKISLSIRDAEERSDDAVEGDVVDDTPESYSDGDNISTGLGDLLKKLNIH